MTQNEKIVTGLIITGVLIGGYYLLRGKDDDDQDVVDFPVTDPQVLTDPVKPSQPAPVAPVVLNKNLKLRKGSKGAEVRELQRLLAITIDGDFGTKTESALLARKGVKEITLAAYAKTPDVKPKNPNPLKKGARVMTIRDGVKTYNNSTWADGTFHNTGTLFQTFRAGMEIGKVLSVPADGLSYVVQKTGTFSDDIFWVSASDVKEINR